MAASSAIVGQAAATIDAPSGEASGAIREAGEGVGENAGFIGQGEGDSVILPIFGQGFGTVDGPSGEALAIVVIGGVGVCVIPSATGSGFGTGRLIEVLPGTSISAEFDGRALAADNDDRSLSADLDLRSAG
ncbi:MAG: hypothetical protein KJ911_13180 [Alphaproteobacteria bacterium]|uniref:hypothetical protein n=1 Tax=Brevundimonas sp. TaxID=1871086 RepID=UPI0025C73421|nr:hypothetical protein [Brevundimonas sp.]MBU4197688.1 hypothetical protein [Alphaproteobacteria bacterium]MCG2664138.1 hypothetical protein [Brevundimonas sp.]